VFSGTVTWVGVELAAGAGTGVGGAGAGAAAGAGVGAGVSEEESFEAAVAFGTVARWLLWLGPLAAEDEL
jgi:hypothetical protein